MRLEVQYRLYEIVGEALVSQEYDSFSIIEVKEIEDDNELFNQIKLKLSQAIGKSSNVFKVLGYKEV